MASRPDRQGAPGPTITAHRASTTPCEKRIAHLEDVLNVERPTREAAMPECASGDCTATATRRFVIEDCGVHGYCDACSTHMSGVYEEVTPYRSDAVGYLTARLDTVTRERDEARAGREKALSSAVEATAHARRLMRERDDARVSARRWRDLARHLGERDPAAYYRAVNRWFGKTPERGHDPAQMGGDDA